MVLEERPLHELFCGFWQCQDTTQSQMARKLTKLVGVRVTPVVVVAPRGAAAREAHAMRQTKQNKTKRSRAEQSGVSVERWQLLIHSQ